MKKTYICPCCGFDRLDAKPFPNMPSPTEARNAKPPYGDLWGMGSYEVCSCCGFEFGNDDDPGIVPGSTFEEYLLEFIEDGCQWFEPKDKPTQWNLQRQLEDAGLPVPKSLQSE